MPIPKKDDTTKAAVPGMPFQFNGKPTKTKPQQPALLGRPVRLFEAKSLVGSHCNRSFHGLGPAKSVVCMSGFRKRLPQACHGNGALLQIQARQLEPVSFHHLALA